MPYKDPADRRAFERRRYATSPERRASVRRAGRVYALSLRAKVMVAQAGRCAACGAPLGPTAELDHLTPAADRGPRTPSNLRAVCRPCNRKRGRKPLCACCGGTEPPIYLERDDEAPVAVCSRCGAEGMYYAA